MYSSIIKLLDKLTPSKAEIGLAWKKAQEADKTLKKKGEWLKFRSIKGRHEYLTEIMKKEAVRIGDRVKRIQDKAKRKRDMEEMEEMREGMGRNLKHVVDEGGKTLKLLRKRANPVYTVSFRVLTKTGGTQLYPEGKRMKGKSSRTTQINGIPFKQIGREYAFQTKSIWFLNNFNSKGTKLDYIVRADRGTKGSRWDRTVKHVMQALEGMEAHHIISYMDAVYIPKVTSSADDPEPTDIKRQKKHDDTIKGLYNEYLYHEMDQREDRYKNHPYLKDNFKPMSCMLTAIVETYYEEFQKVKPDGKRKYKQNLTYEYLCDLFQLECAEDNIGCTIQEALPFFQKFHLGLKVYDIYNSIVENFVPPERQRNIKPSTMHLVTYNGHVYPLTDNIKELQQKADKIGASPIDVDKISQNYHIINQKDDNEYYYCDTWDDIMESIGIDEDDEDEEAKEIQRTVKIKYVGVLNQLVYELAFEKEYVPKVAVDGSMVTSIWLNLKRKNRKYNIWISSIDQGTTIDNHSGQDLYEDLAKEAKAYGETYATFYQWLINRKHLSTYDKPTYEMEKDTMLTPLCCSFRWTDENLIALDMNKAYTSNLRNMTKFPSFSAFDKYLDYDGHPIEDSTMYYIKAVRSDDESSILFASRFSRAYGFKLNRISRDLFEILSFKRPSNLTDTNAKQRIKELYDDESVSQEDKKQIINVLIGLLEKKSNNKSSCKLFLDKGEGLRGRKWWEIRTFEFL